jgi:hypothetical protein
MKIQRATFLGVRGVADATLDLTDPKTGAPHGVVMVTGPSASGKTRLIEALIAAKEAIAPLAMPPVSAPWIGAGNAAKIILTFHLDQAEREFAGTASPIQEGEVIFTPGRPRAEAEEGLRAVLDRYSHDRAHGKLEYFPVSRRIPSFPPFHGLGSAEQRLQRPGKDPRKYGFVVQLLRELERDTARAARFGALLEALSSTLRHHPSGSTEPFPRCFTSRGGAPATAVEISDGEADAVIFAATALVVGLDRSLVFVDRPDLHADDPGHLLAGLSALGADNQLILAVRPELAAAAAHAPGLAAPHVVALKAP